MTYVAAAAILGCSAAAVGTWVRRWREAGGDLTALETRPGKRGPKPALSERQAAELVRAANRDGRVALWRDLAALARARGIPGTGATVRRRLQALGYEPRLTSTGRTRWEKTPNSA